MTVILHIESATKVCSVALSRDGELLALRETQDTDYAHSRLLTVYIQEVLKEAGTEMKDLSAVAVSRGPGSYTGLRIGVSAAKGICYGLDIPLLAVDTLESMAFHCRETIRQDKSLVSPESLELHYCPMIDARRMEVYYALYDHHIRLRQAVQAAVIDKDSFLPLLHDHKILFFGDGADKCQALIDSHNALFMPHILPSARGMLATAHSRYTQKQFESTAYFEPFYLKNFIAGAPRVKGLYG